jgi:CRP-like cAMP-binding protein
MGGDAAAGLAIAERFATGYRVVSAGKEIYAEGEPSNDLYIVTEGWVFQYQILEDGRRQILDFALPGTLLGFQPQPGEEMGHTAEALTCSRVAVIPRQRLGGLFAREPEFALRFVSAAADALNLAYENITDVGRRTAREAVAHLLLRLFSRIRTDNGGAADTIAFPLTQEHIADALGLTAVHVCRTLRALRTDGVVKLSNATLAILDIDRLVEIAASRTEIIALPGHGGGQGAGARRLCAVA